MGNVTGLGNGDRKMKIAMPERGRRGLSACALVCAFLLLGGCSQLYMHYDGYEKATAEAKADVEKIDVAGAFNDLAADADALAKTEDDALAGSLMNQRDGFLAMAIEPLPGDWSEGRDTDTTRERFDFLAKARFSALVENRPGDPQETDYYLRGPDRLLAIQRKAADAEANVARLVKIYTARYKPAEQKDKKDKKTEEGPTFSCAIALEKYPDAAPIFVDDLPPGSALERDYFDLARNCNRVKQANAESDAFLCVLAFEAEHRKRCDPKLIADSAGLVKRGDIPEAAWELILAARSMAANKALAAKTSAEAKALAKKMEVADSTEQLRKQLDGFLKQLDGLSGLEKLAGLEPLQAFFKCGLIADLKAAAATDDDAGGAGGEKAGVTTAGGVAKSAAEDSSCEAGAKAAEDEGPEGKINGGLSLALKTFLQLKRDGDAVERLERIDAMLVTLSRLKLHADLAQAQVDLDNTKITLYRGRLLALLSGYRSLQGMEQAIPKLPATAMTPAAIRGKGSDVERKDLGIALSRYAEAWDFGVIPAELLRLRFLHAERKYRIQVATINAANYKATVQPIADALAIYGAGGITPDMIVQWLEFLGIAKIAVTS